MSLTDGGERVDVGDRPTTHTELDHLCRYQWAASRVRGRRVLDVACGTGYGSELMARHADVVGIDNEPSAVEAARARVPSGSFLALSVPPIPQPEHSFDAVVTFETIEHIEDDGGFIREIARLLRSDGCLLLSTPNKAVTSPDGPPSNPWHVREYFLQDLLTLLWSEGFTSVDIYCQGIPRRGRLAAIALRAVATFPVLCKPGRWWDVLAHGTGEVEPWDGASTPLIWVLACRLA